MRGYFGIGVEGISKPMNLGNLMRSAHGFGARFFFTVDATRKALAPASDTSRTVDHMPIYHWRSVAEMTLPERCQLVGIEIAEDAIDLPSFGHPLRAAYVLGAERGGLSPEMLARCNHVVRIPTTFSINLATAGAIVMYDRLRALGRFARRPVRSGGPVEEFGEPVFGPGLARCGGKSR